MMTDTCGTGTACCWSGSPRRRPRRASGGGASRSCGRVPRSALQSRFPLLSPFSESLTTRPSGLDFAGLSSGESRRRRSRHRRYPAARMRAMDWRSSGGIGKTVHVAVDWDHGESPPLVSLILWSRRAAVSLSAVNIREACENGKPDARIWRREWSVGTRHWCGFRDLRVERVC